MNDIMELLNGLGGTVVAGGVAAVSVLALFLILKKKKKTKKSSGGYDYGDTTTAGYDTKAGNFVDELNSDSVLTQDVQDFAVPNFDRDVLEASTKTKGYKKKVFNSSIPGMTLGDSRPMVPLNEEDLEGSLNIKASPTGSTGRSSVGGFGLKPKTMNAVDIATITTSGLKVLDDVEQLMRPAAPEKVSASSPIQNINVPMSMKVADMDLEKNIVEDNTSFDLKFGEPPISSGLPELKIPQDENIVPVIEQETLSFGGLPEIKIDTIPSVASENVYLEMKLEEPKETLDLFMTNKETSVSDTLDFFTMDTSPVPPTPSVDDIDVSDIPGLNLQEVDSAAQVSAIPHIVEMEKDPEFMKVVSLLDEKEFPETVAYHQEITAAMFLDDEGMKEQALQTMQNTLELIQNIKVKFYFKLAIQSYTNSTKEKALPEIMRNFYNFEKQKYSK